MRTLKELAEFARSRDVRVRVDPEGLERAAKTPDDILFQVPLIALTLLVLARARKGKLLTSEMTTWAFATLARHLRDVRDGRRRVDWSFALRRRCADALVFLENRGLVTVLETPQRHVKASASGLVFLTNAVKDTSDLGVLVRALNRAHRAVEQMGLELG